MMILILAWNQLFSGIVKKLKQCTSARYDAVNTGMSESPADDY